MITQPTLFKPIGTRVKRQGVELEVVKRPDNLKPCQACEGCFFDKSGIICNTKMMCSSFDRADRVSVWFQEVRDTNK